jgi:Holliday junction resolvasome RuvABC endonuclease subunit
MKVLGLDVSTSNVGLCLLDTECPQSSSLILAVGIPIGKKKGLYAKSCEVREALERMAHEHRVDVVVIEESLQAFRSRMSSAHTIATLNRFNGIVSYISRTVTGAPVVLGNVIAVRKALGIKLDKKSPVGTKEQVLQWVKCQEPMSQFSWPTKDIKSGPNKGTSRMADHCYDIADAYVMARWGADNLKIADLDDTIL